MKKVLLAFSALTFSFSLFAQNTQSIWTMTNMGGANGGGTIVKMNPDGTGFSAVYSFLYATGDYPYGNIIQASDGNLYATTEDGGPSGSCVIFRFDPINNIYTDVHDFWGPDGYIPMSGLTEYNGNLYGVTIDGGANNYGVIYRYNLATGVYTDVYDFDDTLGSTPYAALTLANGKLYGTTFLGGINNNGVLFSFDPSNNSYTVLHHFNMTVDGSQTNSALLHASNGRLYGCSQMGGANTEGTLYCYDPVSTNFNVLYHFSNATGSCPLGAMTEANGVLYGTANLGGSHGSGVIFSYDVPSATYTDLHDFNNSEGTYPQGDLFLSTNGLLFGTASNYGAGGYGSIFSFDPSVNTFSTVHLFNGTDGSTSYSGFCLVTTPTGVNDPSANENIFNVFPNPAHDVIDLSASLKGDVSFTILNSLGQSVKEWNESAMMNYHKLIDVSDLESGIYFLEMKNGSEVVTKKFMKE